MKKLTSMGLIWVTLMQGYSGIGAAQGAAIPDMWDTPLVSCAWEAGCLQPEECDILETALLCGKAFRWTQQGVAQLFEGQRRREVVACLRTIPEWREVFSASLRNPVPLKSKEIRWRWEGRKPVSDGPSVFSRIQWTSSDPKGNATGFRVLKDEGKPRWESAHFRRAGKRSTFWGGTLSARFGQGLIMWTASPFDDLGGMEGTHRLGPGLGFVRSPQRGMILGAGWQQRKALGRRWTSWGVLGRTWPDLTGVVSVGLDFNRWACTLKWQELKTGRSTGLIGWTGKATRGGWSTRWAVALFEDGWEARASVLRTWSERWEAHAVCERTHPRHPRWESGEVRSSLPSIDALPGADWICGVAFDEGRNWSGWARWFLRWEGPPPFRLRRRSAFRLVHGSQRLDFRTRWGPVRWSQTENGGEPEFTSWSMAFRKEMVWSNGSVCRIHVNLAGRSGAWAGVLALTMGWKDVRGRGFRAGIGQSFGSEVAPLRFVSGWDGRPAEPFGKADFKGFFRWRSSGGKWRVGLQLGMRETAIPEDRTEVTHGIHAIRVEFRPRWS